MWLDPRKELEREKFEQWKQHPLTDIDIINCVSAIEHENEELKKEVKKYEDFFIELRSFVNPSTYHNIRNEVF